MKFDTDNNVLTLHLSGRIDANNSAETEAEISEVLAENPGIVPAFDASELEYISSAGLRVLLKFRKAFGKNLDVLNASSEVYEIFEVTGFTELLNVRKRLREVSIEGCPEIGSGYDATVYRIDSETVIKVFNKHPITLEKIEHDQKIAREAFVLGIPTAISYDVVRSGGYYGIVYEMINADTLAGVVLKAPERIDELSRKAGTLLRKLHQTEFKPGILPDIIPKWRESITTLQENSIISADEAGSLNSMLDRIPSRNTFIHYDFHPKNIMIQDNELVLIDIGDAALGYPAVDWGSLNFLCILLPPILQSIGVPSERIAGLSAEALGAYWRGLLSAYFGTTDEDKISAYETALSPYGRFRALDALTGYAAEKGFGQPRPILRKTLSSVMEVMNDLQPIEGL